MKKKYVIYKVTNTINSKMYIGKTYNFERRKGQHINDINDDLPFHKALKKYGLENFLWEIIDTASTNKEALNKEIYWIRTLNTCIKSKNSKGYNITIGGEGGVSWNSRPIVQYDLQGNYVGEYESCTSAGVMNNIQRRDILRCCNHEIRRAGQYIWKFKSEFVAEKIKPYEKPESALKKRIVQLDLDGNFIAEYHSVKDAGIKTLTRRTTISGCLIGDYDKANGYQWLYKEKYDTNQDYKYKGKKYGNGVVQLDTEGNFIKRFNNCAEAARELKASSHKIIHKALDNLNKTSCGFKWLKYDTYIKLTH